MYAEVILPLPLAGAFTYSVSAELEPRVVPGCRVVVPFGKRKSYTGIVAALLPTKPDGQEGIEIKDVVEVLDDGPVVKRPQLQLWEWVADYYMCSVGEVMKAALPSGLKLESETFVEPAPDYEEGLESGRLTSREIELLAQLTHHGKPMTVGDLAKKAGVSSVSAVLNRMIAKGAVTVREKLVERFHARKEVYVVLKVPRDDAAALDAAFAAVKRSEKQEKLLLALMDMSGFARRGEPLRDVTRKELMERTGATAEQVKALKTKGLVEIEIREVSRFALGHTPSGKLPELSPAQLEAFHGIHTQWADHAVTLLHGVTSSGKTEIYMHLIQGALDAAKQALYLVPEIALTTQLTERLQDVFGSKVVIYHSKFTDNERVEIWRRLMQTNDPCVVVGARSALFLPFSMLGLVIVDEEHESSYKQQDPAPRYHARDTAIVLAGMHGAKTLLGSATPCVDTYYKALNGRFGLVSLTERYAGAVLPEMRVVDLALARQRKEIVGPFARETVSLVRDALGRGNQAILFLNRRGFAPVATCRQCAFVPRCPNCDVALTYHRHADRLVCHYCGVSQPLPGVCPSCKNPSLEVSGYGTERIEDAIAESFPGAAVSRMDLDTTRNKDAYQTLINDFSERRSQILVGTQMIAKGLDFGGVETVAVVNADAQVQQPDYRATERAFCMIEQVAGRAGRRDRLGVVAIQTRQPEHPIYKWLVNHDYQAFYEAELKERQAHGYPPFTRLIYITVRHRDRHEVDVAAKMIAERLRVLLGTRVSGPVEPPVGRIQNLYIRRIMLKIEVTASVRKVREVVHGAIYDLRNSRVEAVQRSLIHFDVDPV